MSDYGDYIKELYGKEIIENEYGFATYKIFDTGELYVEDMYIKPECRKDGSILKFIRGITKVAVENKCDRVTCCVFLTANKPEEPLRWMLHLGFKIASCMDNNKIFLYIMSEEYLKNEL